jgi:sensor histidine kinase regulating citrate/malate metabolism
MLNLITNAVDAMPAPQTEKNVTVFVEQDNGNVRITVSDNAPSIEKINESKIFEKGFSTKNSTGMGLAYVKEVVTGMNGSINFINNNDSNNFKQFIIKIPLT